MTWYHTFLSLLLGTFLITFEFSGCTPNSGTIFFNAVDDDDDVEDDDTTSDDNDTADDDDIASDDDTAPNDDDSSDDDTDVETYSVFISTDCDELDQLFHNPLIQIDDEQIGDSPLTADVEIGEHTFEASGHNIQAVTYYNYGIYEGCDLHFRCGLAPEGYFDLYSEPCGLGGNFIGTFEVGTVIIDDQVKLLVDGVPSYTIIGPGYYNDDNLKNVLGIISVDLTEISDNLDHNCAYLQE